MKRTIYMVAAVGMVLVAFRVDGNYTVTYEDKYRCLDCPCMEECIETFPGIMQCHCIKNNLATCTDSYHWFSCKK